MIHSNDVLVKRAAVMVGNICHANLATQITIWNIVFYVSTESELQKFGLSMV